MTGRHAKKRVPHKKMSSSRKKTLWASVLTAIVVVAGSGGAIGYYALSRPLSHAAVVPQPSRFGTSFAVEKTPQSAERMNFLFIGTDSRPKELNGNTDVLMFCSLDMKNKRIELLSIPRDTKVMYPDGTYAKINQSMQLGGPVLTESLVQQMIHQPIDHYVVTRFNGLVDIVNTMGGLTLQVEKRMYYKTGDKQYGLINLRPGLQTLNGEQALGYVRYRHDALGDIGRTERQQKFIQALTEQMLQPSTIPKLPTLAKQVLDAVDTDMTPFDVLTLAKDAKSYKGYPIIHETLPGSFHDPDPAVVNDASYWIVNPLQATYVAKQFFEKGIVITNPVQDPAVTANWSPPSPVAPQGPGNQTGGNLGNQSNSTTSSNTEWPLKPLSQEMVATGSSFIRSGPGEQYPVVSSVLSGSKVWVTGKSGDWYEVMLDSGKIGYVADWLLKAESTTTP